MVKNKVNISSGKCGFVEMNENTCFSPLLCGDIPPKICFFLCKYFSSDVDTHNFKLKLIKFNTVSLSFSNYTNLDVCPALFGYIFMMH